MWTADKLAYRLNMGYVRAYQGSEIIWERFTPNNVIYYTSTTGNIVVPYRDGRGITGDDYTAGFGATIISNTYSEGLGIIEFDGPVTKVYYGFYDCIYLKTVSLPDTVTVIDNSAFRGCTSLREIDIPNNVTTIGSNAFYGCYMLNFLKIGSSVTSIGTDAFEGCNFLSYIEVNPNNIKYDSRNNCNSIIQKSNSTLILGSGNSVIPNNVTTIGQNAFKNRYSLTSIDIPASVTGIDNTSYQGTKNVTSITVAANNTYFQSRNSNCIIRSTTNRLRIGCQNTVIPNSVTAIGDYAFTNQENLTSIIIPNSVTAIGVSSFLGTGLVSITIPDTVTSIGNYAFNSSTYLAEVIVNRITPPTLGTYVFSGVSSSLQIKVPVESVETYKTASGWSVYASYIVSQ